jgi:hypothetical protein
MPYKNVVFDDHTFTNECMTRDLATLADNCVLLDLNEGANLGLVSDVAPINIDEARKLYIFAKTHIAANADKLIHKKLLVNCCLVTSYM